jgi:hypothetical protein
MEMRGADAGPWRMVAALPALWTGIMYDEGALAEAQELVQGWSARDIEQLRHEVGGVGCAAAAAIPRADSRSEYASFVRQMAVVLLRPVTLCACKPGKHATVAFASTCR